MALTALALNCTIKASRAAYPELQDKAAGASIGPGLRRKQNGPGAILFAGVFQLIFDGYQSRRNERAYHRSLIMEVNAMKSMPTAYMTRRLLIVAGAGLAVAALLLPDRSAAGRKPTSSEVDEFKKAWNSKLKQGEKPLSTKEAKEILTDYMAKFPKLTVKQIIAKFLAANKK